MKIVNPSNAVKAKLLTKYGKRLRAIDYDSMLKLKRVGEVLLYLKNNTRYSEYLEQYNDPNIHRQELEGILRKNLFFEILNLCKYDSKYNQAIKDFIIRRQEISELIKFITLLSLGYEEEYYFVLPLYFLEYTNIDFKSIALCNTYHEFLECLKDTEYYPLLKEYEVVDNKEIDLPTIEDKLDRLNSDYFFHQIRKTDTDKDKIRALFNDINDITNLHRLFRLKKYYNLPPEEIHSHLRHYGNIPDETLKKMCNCKTSADAILIFNDSKLGKRLHHTDTSFNDDLRSRCILQISNHNLHFSENTHIILISYLLFSEIEIENIITIIEGVRYNLSSDEIFPLLVYKD